MKDDKAKPSADEILRKLAENYPPPTFQKWDYNPNAPEFSMELGLLTQEEIAILNSGDSAARSAMFAKRNKEAAQMTFFTAPGPSVIELSHLSSQCTEAEWTTLVRSHAFIEAACKDLEQTAAIATKLLGRKISTTPINHETHEGHET